MFMIVEVRRYKGNWVTKSKWDEIRRQNLRPKIFGLWPKHLQRCNRQIFGEDDLSQFEFARGRTRTTSLASVNLLARDSLERKG